MEKLLMEVAKRADRYLRELETRRVSPQLQARAVDISDLSLELRLKNQELRDEN